MYTPLTGTRVYLFSVSNSGYYDARNTNSSSFTGPQSVLSMTMRTCNVRRFAVSNINMAFNQTTYMSPENLGFCEGNCTSEHAVDGDRGTSMLRCSLTGPEEKAWWAVKLLSDAKIAKVVVTNGGAYGRKELHLPVIFVVACDTVMFAIRQLIPVAKLATTN